MRQYRQNSEYFILMFEVVSQENVTRCAVPECTHMQEHVNQVEDVCVSGGGLDPMLSTQQITEFWYVIKFVILCHWDCADVYIDVCENR